MNLTTNITSRTLFWFVSLIRVLEMFVPDSLIYLLSTLAQQKKLFDALKESLSINSLDFSRYLAFMSDTVNVMKGTRSGIQKFIRDECSDVFDVGCISHLADLAIKAGMQTLPVDIDHLFVDIFYYFFHSSKRRIL